MLYPRHYLPIAAISLSLALAACATAGGTDSDENGDPVADASPNPVAPDAAPAVDAPVAPDAAADAAPPLPVDCTEDVSISCGELVEHSLFFADESVSGYSCETVATDGVENIYRFVPATTGTVTLTLDVLEDEPIIGDDFDLYVLEDVCGVAACATQSAQLGDENLTFTATGGTTYYIVVEAFSAGLLTLGNYDLSISCQ